MMSKKAYVLCAAIVAHALIGNAFAEEPMPSSILFSESFDDADLLKRSWYDGSRFKIVSEGAFAGKGCVEYRWKEKATNPHTSSGARRLLKATDQLFIRFYIKLSEDWDWSRRSYHPHLAHFLTTENGKWHGPARSHLTLYVEPVNGKLRLGATDMENEKMPHGLTQGPLKGGYNGKLYDSKETVFNDDKWHCIEAQFKLNTLEVKEDKANSDGVIRGWFDGKLVVEHTDIVFRTTDFPQMKWNQFLLTPYFGSGLLPHAQALWIDELVVGTQRIGLLTQFDPNASTSVKLSTGYHVAWPADEEGFILEEADSVNGLWTLSERAPTVVDGQNIVVMDGENPKKFYRLVKSN